MSYGREYMADHEFEKDHPFGIPGDTWHSKNGDIKLRDMTDSHIRNCMDIVGADDPWYKVFAKELGRRVTTETVYTVWTDDPNFPNECTWYETLEEAMDAFEMLSHDVGEQYELYVREDTSRFIATKR